MAKNRVIPSGVYHIRHTCGTAHALCGHTFPAPPILITHAEEQANQECVVCAEMKHQPCLICGGAVLRPAYDVSPWEPS